MNSHSQHCLCLHGQQDRLVCDERLLSIARQIDQLVDNASQVMAPSPRHRRSQPGYLSQVKNDRAVELGEPAQAEAIRRELELNGCPTLHWWGERFRGGNFPPHALPPSGSYLSDLFAAHGGARATHLAVSEWRERTALGTKIHRANNVMYGEKKRAAVPRTRVDKTTERLLLKRVFSGRCDPTEDFLRAGWCPTLLGK
jgi:hypothetical protein